MLTSKSRWRQDVSLKPYTTLKVGGKAAYFFEPQSWEDLSAVQTSSRDQKTLPFYILGYGSNLLVQEGVLEGWVLSMRRLNKFYFEEECVVAQAGVSLAGLIQEAKRQGRAGLESLWGIPGSVGGALAMNAGGRFGSIGDVVEWVEVIEERERVRLNRNDIVFSYRSSNLQNRLIYQCAMRLKKSWGEETQKRYEEVIRYKLGSQPLRERSAGCVMKNPVIDKKTGERTSAAALLEELGFKGKRRGDAEVSKMHSNFIVNRGQATFDDVFSLMQDMRKTAYKRKGILLEPEIKIWSNRETNPW